MAYLRNFFNNSITLGKCFGFLAKLHVSYASVLMLNKRTTDPPFGAHSGEVSLRSCFAVIPDSGGGCHAAVSKKIKTKYFG